MRTCRLKAVCTIFTIGGECALSEADNAEWVEAEHPRKKDTECTAVAAQGLAESRVYPLVNSVDFRGAHDRIQ